MPAAVKLRTDYSVDELRRLAKGSKDANQSRRLLSLAVVLDGMNRADAARFGGMDRQTLRAIGPTSVNPNDRWYKLVWKGMGQTTATNRSNNSSTVRPPGRIR